MEGLTKDVQKMSLEAGKLRQAAEDAVRQGDRGRYFQVFMDAWAFLSGHQRSIATLFDVENLKSAINRIVMRIYGLHRLLLCPEKNEYLTNGGGYILTGPRGVGKSTLLRGVKEILPVIAPKLIVAYKELTEKPVTWQLPTELLAHAAEMVMQGHFAETAKAVAHDDSPIELYTKTLPSKGYYCVLLLDEVQCIYDAESEHLPRAKDVISMLAQFGKSGTTLAVVSGSSNNTRALLHKDSSIEAKHKGFADLNYSVFSVCSIKPIRRQNDLEGVLRQFGRDKDEACRVFWETGGIARDILGYMRGGSSPSHEQYLEQLRSELQNDRALQHIVYNLIPKSDTPNWTIPLLSRKAVNDYLEKFDRLNKGLPGRWIDAGILVDLDDGLQLAQPALIPHLRNELSAGGTVERLAMVQTLLGWGGAPSPGHLNERYILRQVAEKCLLVWNGKVAWKSRRLKLAKGRVEIVPLPTADGMDDTQGEQVVHLLKSLFGELFNSFTGEEGIDGLAFRPTPRDTTAVEVDVVQIKTGRWPQAMDASAMNAVIYKAREGWSKLTETLRSVLKTGKLTRKLKLVPGSFTLITSKAVDQAVEQILMDDATFFPLRKTIIAETSFTRDVLDDDVKLQVFGRSVA